MIDRQVNKTVPDEFQAFLVEGARFTEDEEYPILRKDMIPLTEPQAIMPFEKAITFRGDLSNIYICTHSPDRSFQRIRNNPKRYLNFFKRTAGIIGFDFSIHTDMPVIKQKKQIDDNLSLTYYYGNNGIPIIPSLRCGIPELLPEMLQSIPRNCMVEVGTHGFIKTKREKYEWYCFLDEVLKELNPSKLIVYGSLKGELFRDIREQTQIIEYEPWSTSRRKGVL